MHVSKIKILFRMVNQICLRIDFHNYEGVTILVRSDNTIYNIKTASIGNITNGCCFIILDLELSISDIGEVKPVNSNFSSIIFPTIKLVFLLLIF